MPGLDQSIIDLAFLDGITEWLKAHPEILNISISTEGIEVMKYIEQDPATFTAHRKWADFFHFDNANELLEWIRTYA